MNPDLRIIGRIRHERNIEAIHQAGADFVMGSASLGIESVLSILAGKPLILLGEDVKLFSMTLPAALKGRTLIQSDIGARTALTVVAIRQNGPFVTSPPASTRLYPGAELLVIGNVQQQQAFAEAFGH
jgi:Trk K+ transport system NAD-binding subunit